MASAERAWWPLASTPRPHSGVTGRHSVPTCGSYRDLSPRYGNILGVDPVTIVVAAIALGAQEGVRDTAKQVVKDAYAGLKRLISERYKGVDPTSVETKPTSEAKRASLEEDLKDAGADSDVDLLAAAKAVIEAVRAENPQAGEPIGVNLEEIEAEAIRIHNVWSSGGGVQVRGAKVSGPIDISNVTSGQKGSSSTP
jgi:hypothetical protein